MTNQLFETPILFLIFNRPGVTQQVFEQIKKIQPKYLYIAADGPRKNRPDDLVNCEETRKIITNIDWDCELHTLYREDNLGCGPAVSSAISWFFENVEAGIVLEDDCFPDLSFFQYCDNLLDKYKNEETIKFIGGNNFQQGRTRGDGSYYFSHYPTSWGWATWRRSWDMFESDIQDSTDHIKNGRLDAIFNSKMEKKHWINSLTKAHREGNSVWDFHFYYAIWKSNGICITPNQNLVLNLGFFDGGTHYFLKDSAKMNDKNETIQFPLVHPTKMEVDREADIYTFQNFYSHSLSRAIRLIRENDVMSIFRYFKTRISG